MHRLIEADAAAAAASLKVNKKRWKNIFRCDGEGTLHTFHLTPKRWMCRRMRCLQILI
jgi:hypothetical protein